VLVLDEAKRKNVRLEGKANYFDKTGKEMKDRNKCKWNNAWKKKEGSVVSGRIKGKRQKLWLRGIQFSESVKWKEEGGEVGNGWKVHKCGR
jgi:hypothetical protein